MAIQNTYNSKGRINGVSISIKKWKKLTKKYKGLATIDKDLSHKKKETLYDIDNQAGHTDIYKRGLIKLKTVQQVLDEL